MANERKSSKFVEQIEACRPGSNDLQSEDFALAAEHIASDADARQCYERLQQSDARVAMAFHDVPVPEGLADRLLAALDVAAPVAARAPVTTGTPVTTGGDFAAAAIASPAANDRSVELHPAVNSRRLVLWLTIAASLLALVGGGLVVVSQLTPYSDRQCLAEAAQAHRQLKAKADQWDRQLSAAPADRSPKTRLFGSIKAWQPIALLGDTQAVAFQFKNGATLLVCQPSKAVAALPIAPPAVPQQQAQQSSGTHVAAWNSGDLVHVLMVNGSIEDYRRMTGTTRPVVAHARPQTLPDRYDG